MACRHRSPQDRCECCLGQAPRGSVPTGLATILLNGCATGASHEGRRGAHPLAVEDHPRGLMTTQVQASLVHMHDRPDSMTDLRTIAQTCLATNARRSARALSRRYDRALAPFDLRITQFAVLVAAGLAREDMTLTDIADVLGLERSSLSRNLQPLERRGLIAIGPERQHRARELSLTEKGAALVSEAKVAWSEVQAESEKLLGDDLDRTLVSLRRLSTLS